MFEHFVIDTINLLIIVCIVTGGFSIKGVIRNPTPTPKIRKRSKVKAPATKKGKKSKLIDPFEVFISVL